MSQVIQDFQVNGRFPSTVGGTGTTVKYFGRNVAYAAGATWTSPLTPSSSSAAGALIVPGDNKLNGTLMSVLATGDFFVPTADSSEVVTVSLYAVTGTLSAPVYTTLATNAYTTIADGVYYNFLIKCDLFGDNNSGIVGGTQQVVINNTVATSTGALTNSLTGISFGQTSNSPNQVPGSLGGPFGLVVGLTFGASNAGNVGNLYQFSVSA